MSTSDLQRLADLVMAKALLVKDEDGSLKYDIRPGKRTGGRKRLAEDSGMDPGQLGRLLSAERMPDVRLLVRLARSIGTTVDALFTESDNYPTQTASQGPAESLRSRLLTPDGSAGRQADKADVRAMQEQLRRKPKAAPDDDQEGRAKAQG